MIMGFNQDKMVTIVAMTMTWAHHRALQILDLGHRPTLLLLQARLHLPPPGEPERRGHRQVRPEVRHIWLPLRVVVQDGCGAGWSAAERRGCGAEGAWGAGVAGGRRVCLPGDHRLAHHGTGGHGGGEVCGFAQGPAARMSGVQNSTILLGTCRVSTCITYTWR